MSNEVWFSADLHFGHKNIIKFCSESRPFDNIEAHNEELVKRHNEVVKPDDVVWHLGDIAFGKDNLHYLGRMNGRKKLVMGNHDMYKTVEYMKYYSRLAGVIEYQNIILSHIPVNENQFARWDYNVHGHLHQNNMDDPRYLNVGVDQFNLYPVPLYRIKEIFKDRLDAVE